MCNIFGHSEAKDKSSKVNHQEIKNNKMDLQEIESRSATEDEHMEVDISNEETSQEAEVRASTEAKTINFRTSLSDLDEPQLSPTFYVRDLQWQIKLEQNSIQMPTKTLGFYLRCNGVSQTSPWNCFAVVELRLLKQWRKRNIYFENTDDAFTRKISHVFNADENEAGFASFISWEDLCDPRRGFIRCNNLEVQAHVKAGFPHIDHTLETNVEIQEYEKSSEIIYHLKVRNLSTLHGVLTSPTFNIHNMPFQLVLQTIPDEKPSALSLFLMCLGDSKHPHWSCYVEAALKLLNRNSNGKACTRNLKHLFCRSKTHCGYQKFISWKHFLDRKNGFVKKDTAHFEIEVKVGASAVSKIQIDGSKHNRDQKEIKMQCTLYNISQLKSTLFVSPFYVRNLPWRIKLMQRTCVGPIREIQRYLSIYLQCDEDSTEAWSCKVIAAITLLKQNSEECGRELHYMFSKERICSGFSHFYPWNEILDPKAKFIRNDSITLLVHMKAEEPCGISENNII